MKKLFTLVALLTIMFSTARATDVPYTVGSTDSSNPSGWWTVFSDYYTISGNGTYHFEFTNYNFIDELGTYDETTNPSGVGNWNNWLLGITSDADRGSCTEYLILRSDNWGWGDNYNENARTSYYDWNNFMTYMDGANVIMDVVREGSIVRISSYFLKGDTRYYYCYTLTGVPETDDLRCFLFVEKSYINITKAVWAPRNETYTQTIGTTDYTSTYRASLGDKLVMTPGQTINVKFRSFGNAVPANWDNWLCDYYTASDDALVTTVRADWWAFEKGTFTDPYKMSTDGGQSYVDVDWEQFASDMNDALVDLKLTYESGTLHIEGTATGNVSGKMYRYEYDSPELSGNVYVDLSTELSWIGLISQEIYGVNGANLWVPFSSNNALDLSDLNSAKAYTASYDGENTVTFNEVTGTVPANTGLLLKFSSATSTNIPIVASSTTTVSDNCLQSTAEGTKTVGADETVYVFGKKGDNEGYYLAAEDYVVSAGKSYVLLPASSAAKTINFVFDNGETTAIKNISECDTQQQTVAKYLENGRLIINHNGKKYNAVGQSF